MCTANPLQSQTDAPGTLVSVVMPIYNVGDVLDRAVLSVLRQGVPVELLLVDDGSTDGSAELCDRLATQFPAEIRVFHQPNGGVLSARTLGLRHASGNYLIHCDPDDVVPEGAYRRLIETMEAQNADFVLAPFQRIRQSDGEMLPQDMEARLYDYRLARLGIKGAIDGQLFFEEILRGYIHSGLWNKMIRRSLLNETVLRRLEEVERLNFLEDRYILMLLLLYNRPRIYIMNDAEPVYHYYVNTASITENIDLERFLEGQIILERIERMVAAPESDAMAPSEEEKHDNALPPLDRHRLQQAALAGRARIAVGGVMAFGNRKTLRNPRFPKLTIGQVASAPVKGTIKTLLIPEMLGIPLARPLSRTANYLRARRLIPWERTR